jgi:hypothetical protein
MKNKKERAELHILATEEVIEDGVSRLEVEAKVHEVNETLPHAICSLMEKQNSFKEIIFHAVDDYLEHQEKEHAHEKN